MNKISTAETDRPESPNWARAERHSVLYQCLAGLASLKLTVLLLALGTLMTWVASLEQTRMDIWEVKKRHFYSPIVYIPLETFCVPAWTPPSIATFFSREINGVKIGIPMPSGALLMALMAMNLFAAHIVRFRIKGQGTRLLAGLGVFGLGASLTTMVVLNGQNSKGFQAEPIFSWWTLWVVVQICLAATVASSIAGAIRLGKEYRVERTLLWLFAIFVGSLLIFLLFQGRSAFIGESAMRILWQLIQGTVGAVVMLIGCHFIFGRKSGIVVLHLGLVLLMFGEFFVTYTAKEQRLTMEEGQTVSHTIDIRDFEMAIMKQNADGTEDIICVPSAMLKPQSNWLSGIFERSNQAKSRIIDNRALPFNIRPLSYLRNSYLEDIAGRNLENPATKGLGLHAIARESAINTGTSAEQKVDVATVYVELLDKNDPHKSLGVFMLSQQLYNNERIALDEVTVNGITYRLGLRFKHFYKPYSIHLLSTIQDNYPGTQIPRSFSSEFIVDYPALDLHVKKKVWMNNPLRFGNETFYQQHYDERGDGPRLSVLQVVKNTGWMIPYVCCMMVAVGLLVQFGQTLLKFLRSNPATARQAVIGGIGYLTGFQLTGRFGNYVSSPATPAQRGATDELAAGSSASQNLQSSGAKRSVSMPLVIGFIWLLFCLWLLAMSMDRPQKYDEMRLEKLGKVPIIFGGRVQPLDSLARNLVKKLTQSGSVEVLVNNEGDEKRQEKPIRFLADLIFTEDGYQNYYVFKINHPELQQALGLNPRKGHRYT
ncbi:MAG TPA: hypothetical protein PKA83_16500, partial [Pirellulaceae bacterium]|nr:hypothetical protein [Pirellulaceae bacterium]